MAHEVDIGDPFVITSGEEDERERIRRETEAQMAALRALGAQVEDVRAGAELPPRTPEAVGLSAVPPAAAPAPALTAPAPAPGSVVRGNVPPPGVQARPVRGGYLVAQEPDIAERQRWTQAVEQARARSRALQAAGAPAAPSATVPEGAEGLAAPRPGARMLAAAGGKPWREWRDPLEVQAEEQRERGRWAQLAGGLVDLGTLFATRGRGTGGVTQIVAQAAAREAEEVARARAERAAAGERLDREKRERIVEERAAQRRDPQSEANRRYREVLAQRLPGVSVPETLTVEDTESRGLLEGMAAARDRAEALRQTEEARVQARAGEREDVQAHQREQQRERIEAQQRLADLRARAHGRGGGGGAGLSVDEQREAVVADLQQRLGLSRAEAEARVRGLRSQEMRQLAMTALRTDIATAGAGRRAEGRAAARTEQGEAEHRVPGWTRGANAPALGPAERSNVRNAAAEERRVRALSQRMERLAAEIPTIERASPALSERMAEARATHEQVISALRVMGNYGAPVESELARMEQLAPRLNSVDGVLSAVAVYRTLPRSVATGLDAWMGGMGYAREAAAAQGQIRIRLPNGMTGRWPADRPLPEGASRL